MKIRVKTVEGGRMPERKTVGAAGFDCYAIDEKAEYDATFAGPQTASIFAAVATAPRPIPTGLVSVDRLLEGGFDYGMMYVLASAPGMGKTTLALQLAANISANGSNVIYVSLIEDERTLTRKNVSRCTREISEDDALTTWQLDEAGREDSRAHLSDGQLATMKQAWGHYYEQTTRLWIVDRPTSIDDLERLVANHKRLTGNTPFVVLDSLQYLRPCDGQQERSISDQCVENMMRLKILALQHRLPLLVLSSVSRTSYYTAVSLNSLVHARGIEQAADMVLGLQPSKYSQNDKRAGKGIMAETMAKAVREMSLSCVKSRSGELGKAVLRYHAAYNFFETGPHPQETSLSASFNENHE